MEVSQVPIYTAFVLRRGATPRMWEEYRNDAFNAGAYAGRLAAERIEVRDIESVIIDYVGENDFRFRGREWMGAFEGAFKGIMMDRPSSEGHTFTSDLSAEDFEYMDRERIEELYELYESGYEEAVEFYFIKLLESARRQMEDEGASPSIHRYARGGFEDGWEPRG